MSAVTFCYICAAIQAYVVIGGLLDCFILESWFSSWRPSYVRALAWPLFLSAFVICKLTILFKSYAEKK